MMFVWFPDRENSKVKLKLACNQSSPDLEPGKKTENIFPLSPFSHFSFLIYAPFNHFSPNQFTFLKIPTIFSFFAIMSLLASQNSGSGCITQSLRKQKSGETFLLPLWSVLGDKGGEGGGGVYFLDSPPPIMKFAPYFLCNAPVR